MFSLLKLVTILQLKCLIKVSKVRLYTISYRVSINRGPIWSFTQIRELHGDGDHGFPAVTAVTPR